MDSLSEVISEAESQRKILLVSWSDVVTVFDREFDKVFLSKNSKARFDMSDIIVDGAKQNWSALLLLDAVLCLLSKKHPQDHRSNRRVFDQHRMLRFCCRSEYLSRLERAKAAEAAMNKDQETSSVQVLESNGKTGNADSTSSDFPLKFEHNEGITSFPPSQGSITFPEPVQSNATAQPTTTTTTTIPTIPTAAPATSSSDLNQHSSLSSAEDDKTNAILFVPPICLYNDDIDGVRVVDICAPWCDFDLFREESLSKRKGLAKRDRIISDFWQFIEQRPLGMLLQEAFEQSLELVDLSYSVNTTPFEVTEEEMSTIYLAKRPRHKKAKGKFKNKVLASARYSLYSTRVSAASIFPQPSGQVEQDTKSALSSLLDAAAISTHLYPPDITRSFSQAPSLLSLAMAAPISASIVGDSSTSLRPRRDKRKAMDAFPAYLVDSIMMGAMSDTNGIRVTNNYIMTHSKCRSELTGLNATDNSDSPPIPAVNMTAPGGMYSADIDAHDDDAVWNKGQVSDDLRRLPGVNTKDDVSSCDEEEDIDKLLSSDDAQDE